MNDEIMDMVRRYDSLLRKFREADANDFRDYRSAPVSESADEAASRSAVERREGANPSRGKFDTGVAERQTREP